MNLEEEVRRTEAYLKRLQAVSAGKGDPWIPAVPALRTEHRDTMLAQAIQNKRFRMRKQAARRWICSQPPLFTTRITKIVLP